MRYDLPEPGHVVRAIYNSLGQEVRRLVDGHQPAGSHDARWDGTDHAGRFVGLGVYYYRLIVGDFSETRTMLLLR